MGSRLILIGLLKKDDREYGCSSSPSIKQGGIVHVKKHDVDNDERHANDRHYRKHGIQYIRFSAQCIRFFKRTFIGQVVIDPMQSVSHLAIILDSGCINIWRLLCTQI